MQVRIRYFYDKTSLTRIFGEHKLAESFFYPTFGLMIFLNQSKESQNLLTYIKNLKFIKNNTIIKSSIILIVGDLNIFKFLAEELRGVYEDLSNQINELLENYIKANGYNYRIGKKSFIGTKKYVMGILNVTTDSFFDGGKYISISNIKERIDEFIEAGVDIIDIGGESTRPGAEPISVDEELSKVIPAIEYALTKDIIVSLDTYKSRVAEESLKLGVHIINDISGLKFDEKMSKICSMYNASLVIMHILGTPKTMQQNPYYHDTTQEIFDKLKESIELAKAEKIGQIYVDPGIGFGKRVFDNFEILNRLEEFKFLGYPILIGISRKSFIGKVLNQQPEERLTGTIVSNSIAFYKGANIIRVHDAKEAIETKIILENIINPEKNLT